MARTIYNYAKGEYIDTPPEVEAFKKDILQVYEKYGLCILTEDPGDGIAIYEYSERFGGGLQALEEANIDLEG